MVQRKFYGGATMEIDQSKRYFNFPIQLLNGYLNDPKEVLQKIADYAIYQKFKEIRKEKPERTIAYNLKEVAKFFRITIGSGAENYIHRAENSIRSEPQRSPIAGIKTAMLFDFHDNPKTEFENVCLLAYLALKSILGSKPYCKVTNLYLLARMAGRTTAYDDISEVAHELQMYASRYHLDKVKKELVLNWGLKLYARHTRGFYASFTMQLDALILNAEKRRKAKIWKAHKDRERETVNRVLQTLNRN